jgi:hypothetical protein
MDLVEEEKWSLPERLVVVAGRDEDAADVELGQSTHIASSS